jgi:hypothetical protein
MSGGRDCRSDTVENEEDEESRLFDEEGSAAAAARGEEELDMDVMRLARKPGARSFLPAKEVALPLPSRDC